MWQSLVTTDRLTSDILCQKKIKMTAAKHTSRLGQYSCRAAVKMQAVFIVFVSVLVREKNLTTRFLI